MTQTAAFRRQRLPRFVGAIGIVAAVPLTMTACGAGEVIDDARNAGVCSAIRKGLVAIDENIDKVKGTKVPAGAEAAFQQAEGALDAATSTATGQLAASLAGLDGSLKNLVAAVTNGTPESVKQAVAAVKTGVASVKTQCAAS